MQCIYTVLTSKVRLETASSKLTRPEQNGSLNFNLFSRQLILHEQEIQRRQQSRKLSFTAVYI